jgi:hypothetical protein
VRRACFDGLGRRALVVGETGSAGAFLVSGLLARGETLDVALAGRTFDLAVVNYRWLRVFHYGAVDTFIRDQVHADFELTG